MIDQFCAKTTGKKLYVKNKDGVILIAEPQEGKKPKLIDMAFGNFLGVVNDLKSNGYQVEIFE